MSYVTWAVVCAVLCYFAPVLLFYVHYSIKVTCHLLNRFGFLGNDFMQTSYKVCAGIYRAYAQFWYGHEIRGWKNIPNRPCIFVVYHGALPVDMFHFITKCHGDNISLYTIAAMHLLRIIGLGRLATEYFHLLGSETSAEKCAKLVEAGNHLLILPGGIYEAQTTHHTTYQLMWKERTGFAKIALQSGAPIIPIFTKNINECYRSPRWVYAAWRRLLPGTAVPFLPPVGGLPVKLVTYLGDPIEIDQKLTPSQLRNKVECALNDLIGKHQRIPGDMFQALMDRFRTIR